MLIAKCSEDDEIKMDEMGGSYSTRGTEINTGKKASRQKTTLENKGVDRKVVIKLIIWSCGLDFPSYGGYCCEHGNEHLETIQYMELC